MAWGKFSGCACCGEINICEPKHQPEGIGEVSVYEWGFYSEEVTDREDAVAKWGAYLVLQTTHAGNYRFEFEQEYTRTFHIPTVDGRSPSFWTHDKIYFSTPATVAFTASDLVRVTVGGGPGDPDLVEDSAEDDAFREAFGGLSPWDVGLTMFPITSIIPPEMPGEVDYPSDYSDDVGIPPIAAPVLEDHLEASWANLLWFDAEFSNLAAAPNWGDGVDPSSFHSYTHHPRGFTFLPSGLGVLNDPIHQFGSFAITTFPFLFLWFGLCYPRRLNAFMAPLSLTISGVNFIPTTPASRVAIMEGINASYTCEWAHTDFAQWQARGEHWNLVVTLGSPELINYPTADEATATSVLSLNIKFEPLFGFYGSSYIGLTAFNGETAELPVTDFKAMASVESYVDGANTHLYTTDPAALVAALAPLLTWTAFPTNPFGQMEYDDLAVSVSA